MSNRRSRIRNRLQQALHGLRKQANPPRTHFTGDMTIDEAWRAHPRAPEVFARYDLEGCDGCAARIDERIEEAADAYDIDLDRLLDDLNRL